MITLLTEEFQKLHKSATDWIWNCVNLFISSLLVASLSTTLYIIFYNLVVPRSTLHTPLNFLFSDCSKGGKCDHPTALVDLQNPLNEFHLQTGEQYEFIVDLVAPESPDNFDIGMFVVSVKLVNEMPKGRHSTTIERKSVMMRYKSLIVRSINAVLFYPLLCFGFTDQSQQIRVNVMDNYVQKPGSSLRSLEVVIESQKLNIYEARLSVNVKIDGFRYFMCHYPFLSYLVGTPFVLAPIVALLLSLNKNPRRKREHVKFAPFKREGPIYAFPECFLGRFWNRTDDLPAVDNESEKGKECDDFADKGNNDCGQSVEKLLEYARKGQDDDGSSTENSTSSESCWVMKSDCADVKEHIKGE